MTAFQRVNVKTNEDDISDFSLLEKWRHFKQEKKKKGYTGKGYRYTIGLIIFQAPTQIYFCINNIFPALYADYDVWKLLCFNIFICFLWIQLIVNFICTRVFDSSYVKQDKGTNSGELLTKCTLDYQSVPHDGLQNDHVVNLGNDQRDDGGISWRYCEDSQMYIPPRSHFCKICKKCILKRDHHCYIVGTCIGYFNQRYFVILTFYTSMVGLLGAYWTISYFKSVYWPEAISWADFFLPVTLFRIIFGAIPIPMGIIIFHAYVEVIFGIIGFFYFNSQISLIAKGKTLFEVAKNIHVKSQDSINTNFVSVFGNLWMLNFLFPVVFILKQPGDGTVWKGVKLDHNSNKPPNSQLDCLM